ncbi:MAG: hypothetical protein ASARMPRED_005418 [Alectoria sarmentosa]|nr:MAG: hypothetical protein ASARMPRED_005418 [Alectoria sarmentosa]
MARTRPSRAKKARSSSIESTDDERLQPTSIRGPSKRLKAKSTTSGSGKSESTTSEPARTLNEMISLDGRTSESGGEELDQGPSPTTTRSHPSKMMATCPLTMQTLDELIRKVHQRFSEEERNSTAPKDHWIAESEGATGAHRPLFAERKLAEPRRPRCGVFLTEPGAWKWIVRTQDCGIFVDATDPDSEKHFIFGVVIRDFLPEAEVLKWMRAIALKTAAMGRDTREAQAKYEKYGSGKADENKDDEDFDPKKR